MESNMNSENNIEKIDRKNEIFIEELMDKDSFMLDWYADPAVPKQHPRYYDGRIEVSIRNAFNSSYGNINVGKDEYKVTDEVVSNLYNYIEINIDKLIKIALNQSTGMYVGESDSLRIKFKSIYISISRINVASEEAKNEIYKTEEEIKNLICSNKLTNNNVNNIEVSQMDEQKNLVPNSLNGFISFDEDGYAFANQKLPSELENDYNNFINNYYLNDNNKVVNNIVSKISVLPYNAETTIAELIDYKPDVAFVSPLTQGIIKNAVLKKCEDKGIKIEENRDEIGGLAYFVKFRKVENA